MLNSFSYIYILYLYSQNITFFHIYFYGSIRLLKYTSMNIN